MIDAILGIFTVDDYECYLLKEEGRIIARCYLNKEEGRWLRMLYFKGRRKDYCEMLS